eukprot:gb/GECH01011189.1/.p1 GENE.gb/GECH01011189.1/~~gb/GECH01011189.1/.p1  ORF type:complete len:208 (+),score=25.76 gb/GECH01011189.1/:1-624(+)
MVKQNEAIDRSHFHKHWQRRVKTWFDQPGRAKRRRLARKKKAATNFPGPINKLRPLVNCPTVRYNNKLRLGRGFTHAELKEAGFNDPHFARTVGISVDPRRTNKSQESLDRNVERLKQYKARLVVKPLGPKPKASMNEVSKEQWMEEVKKAHQVRVPLPYTRPEPTFEARAITDADRKRNVKKIYLGERKKDSNRGLPVKMANKKIK